MNQRKIDQIAEKYDLRNKIDQIAKEWGDHTSTLEELRSDINQSIIRAAIRSEDHYPVPGEVESIYHRLTDEDSSSKYNDARRQLRDYGVDPDTVEGEFINSKQTVLNYLESEYDVDPKRSGSDPRDQWIPIRRRAEQVAESIIDQHTDLDSVNIDVRCFVTNEDGKVKDIEEII